MKEYSQEVIARLLERVAKELERAALQADEETVHDVRVSIRRANQALRVFGSLVDGKAARGIRRRLKSVLDEASAVRDCDIAMGLYGEVRLPSAHPAWEEMRARRVIAESGFRHRVRDLAEEARTGVWKTELGLTAS